MSEKMGDILRSVLYRLTATVVTASVVFAAAGQTSTPSSSSQDEITVFARTQEKTKDRIYAIDDVEIRYKDMKLFADRVELNPETKDVLAEGHVTLQLPRESVSAERLFFNLDTGQGKMEKADGMLQPTIFYRAATIDKKSENLYALKKAWITSCSQPRPRWKFSMSRANLKKDDYVEMWNAVFRVKNIPLFYLPYMRYPINKDRATGFLTPRIGWSGAKGFNYSQSFYLVIGRSADATFTLDTYSARGLGGGLQCRYLFSKGTGGELNLYYFKFRRAAAGPKPANASIIRFNHNQPLPLGFNLVANVDLQSSFDFLREFDNDFGRAVTANRRSEVYLQRSWSHFSLSARALKTETYWTSLGADNTIIKQDLPQVDFSMFKVKLFSPVFVSFASSFHKWEYGQAGEYEKGTQKKSGNLSFHPTLSLPFTAIPWLTANASVTAHLVYYLQSYMTNTRNPGGGLFSRNLEFEIDLAGPAIQKVYRNKEGDPVIKHSIEPFVNYTYETPPAQSDRIITAYASYFRKNQLEYGITNRFYIRKDATPREVIQLTFGQTFYLSPKDGPLSQFWIHGREPRFSEISGQLRYYPATKMNLDVSTRYNPYYNEVSSIVVSANWGLSNDPAFISLSWYKSTNTWIQDEFSRSLGKRHQISGRGGLRLPSLSIELTGEIDYNIQTRKLLYAAATATYHYQCLDFTFDVRVLYFRLKPETKVTLSFGLGSIGKTTDFLGGHEY